MDMQTPPSEKFRFLWKMCNVLVWGSVFNPKGCRIHPQWGAKLPKQIFFLAKWMKRNLTILFQSGHIYMKDVECTEKNKKSISLFSVFDIWSFLYSKLVIFTCKMRNVLKRKKNKFTNFSSWDMVDLVLKLVNLLRILSTKSTIAQKLKIRKLTFYSFQRIAHVSWNLEPLWAGGRSEYR